MENSRCRVLRGSRVEEGQKRVQEDLASVQPLAHILAGRKSRVPEGRIIVIGGAGSSCAGRVRWHFQDCDSCRESDPLLTSPIGLM